MLKLIREMLMPMLLRVIESGRCWCCTQVTILGESAGSCSVFLQTVSVTSAYTSTINDSTYQSYLHIGVTFLTHHLAFCCLWMKQVNISASQHRLDPPSHCSKWGKPWTRCSIQKNSLVPGSHAFLVTYSKGGEGRVTLQGWETTQRARSEPFSLEQLWQPWLDARWDVWMQWSYHLPFFKIWSMNWYYHLILLCQGGPGTLLSCLQEIEDGFDILDATDYGPYPNIDKVWFFALATQINWHQALRWSKDWITKCKSLKRTLETMHFFQVHPARSLNQARWVNPWIIESLNPWILESFNPWILESGHVVQSNQTKLFERLFPQMQPLEMILGFNKDEGLHVIIDLLMDPTNDTNFRLVLILNISMNFKARVLEIRICSILGKHKTLIERPTINVWQLLKDVS